MKHINKQLKSELAILKVKTDLTAKGWMIFEPIVDYWQPFDLLIIHSEDPTKIIKLQVKYLGNESGSLPAATTITNKKGNHRVVYKKTDFDFFAAYLPDVDKVIYPHISYAGKTISTTIRNSYASFYWYEDFLDFTTEANKRSRESFGLEKPKVERKYIRYKVKPSDRPTKDQLQQMLNEMPIVRVAEKYGVSDNAVRRWIKQYGNIKLPTNGHWQKVWNDNRK